VIMNEYVGGEKKEKEEEKKGWGMTNKNEEN
jgi:hypothetical protein